MSEAIAIFVNIFAFVGSSQWENLREIHQGDRTFPNKLELKFIRATLDPRLLQEVGDLDT